MSWHGHQFHNVNATANATFPVAQEMLNKGNVEPGTSQTIKNLQRMDKNHEITTTWATITYICMMRNKKYEFEVEIFGAKKKRILILNEDKTFGYIQPKNLMPGPKRSQSTRS